MIKRIVCNFLVGIYIALLFCGCTLDHEKTDDVLVSAQNEGKTIVKVATLFDRGFDKIRFVVDAFNAEQDEIYLHLVSFNPPEGAENADDCLNRAYASFLTDPPDLYDLFSFNAWKLRNGGLIRDWYPIMEADPMFSFEEYRADIWEKFEIEGKLYHLCTSFRLHGIGGDLALYGSQVGWTTEEFQTFLSEHSDSIGTTQNEMLRSCLWYGTPIEFVDFDNNTCEFQSRAFLDWLAFLKSLPKQTTLEKVKSAEISSVSMHLLKYQSDGYYSRVVGLPSQNRHGPAITVGDSFGLSATTKVADACWSFIKWLLTYETQEARYTDNDLPIRVDVFERLLQRASLGAENPDALFPGLSVQIVNGEPQTGYRPGMPEEEIDYLRDIVENADWVAWGFCDYEDIISIVEEEALAYLAGDRSAEECAKIVQSRVSMLLAERQD